MRIAYLDEVRESLAKSGLVGANPVHVLACMRVEIGTLDHLSRAGFDRAVKDCAEDVHRYGPQMARKIVSSTLGDSAASFSDSL